VSQILEPIQCNLKELIIQFQQLKSLVFSGRLIVSAENKASWSFLIRIGCLSWQTSGKNLDRRWQQHLNAARPNLPNGFVNPTDFQPSLEREGYLLAQLLGKGLLNKQQLVDLMSNTAVEIFFDLIQWCKLNGDSLSYQLVPNTPDAKLTLPLPLLEIAPILRRSIQEWQEWQRQGLTSYSPNLFPIIEQEEKLKKLLSTIDYQNLTSAIDGTQTLRNLAAKQNRNILNLTQYLLPLVKTGAIVLSPKPKEMPTTAETETEADRESHASATHNSPSQPPKTPLVACIDDSPSIHQSMEKIVRERGYRYLSIQEPLVALLTAIKFKPDLIFLDLLMPVVNGYEVCAQIRKAPSLRDMPVIILTGRDGLVDRMRAKIAGSTDFLPKPVESEAVCKMLDKYLVAVDRDPEIEISP
jgi:two-component system, chemotaxis family, response regulator PixG